MTFQCPYQRNLCSHMLSIKSCVKLYSYMNSRVSSHVTALGKSFAANFTLKWLLLRVYSGVSFENAFPWKLFSAFEAWELSEEVNIRVYFSGVWLEAWWSFRWPLVEYDLSQSWQLNALMPLCWFSWVFFSDFVKIPLPQMSHANYGIWVPWSLKMAGLHVGASYGNVG